MWQYRDRRSSGRNSRGENYMSKCREVKVSMSRAESRWYHLAE